MQENVSIIDFSSDAHEDSVTRALISLRRSGSPYPPKQDASDDGLSLYNWLMNDSVIRRYVAIVNDEVAGHISIANPHLYLTEYLDKFGKQSDSEKGFIEISKFFVNPDFQKHGVGGKLFKTAVNTILSLEYSPALAVIDTSVDAIVFYKHQGLNEVGSFDGIHGKNFVFA